MGEPHRRPASEYPAVAPRQHRQRHRIEIQTLLGQPVFVAGGPLPVGSPSEDAKFDKTPQALGEDVCGDTQALLELIESC